MGNACVKVWATKILSEFNKYLQEGKSGIDERCAILVDDVAGIII